MYVLEERNLDDDNFIKLVSVIIIICRTNSILSSCLLEMSCYGVSESALI